VKSQFFSFALKLSTHNSFNRTFYVVENIRNLLFFHLSIFFILILYVPCIILQCMCSPTRYTMFFYG
jgi:hypothetical protein